MPKQLKVSLDFTANTDQAKRQIQDLSKALQQISLKTPSVIDDQQLKKAASAANELQRYLAAAVNVDTGKINLSEFSRQLTKGHTDLKKIHSELTAIGPEGVSAFNKLSQSLIQAEAHSNKLVKKMKEFGTTLANTARWQISSSILHGLTGAVQSAFYYAKDLDESLNNIRIVTGQNADQMARFAKEANAAAQSLSTTTTAYTNASLIYYQQGLSDKEVKERTDVTVKMANVTGESAQTISEQMTAVWNNFYDGSQSLESFSDKMVALGAATASSSSEISAGLNQFAATANTVGLSFDYAAAALATVTATTRQSANVVGNAFKTLFARLEGLKLGETLEDGTTLNKYSAALESVGVSIKDQNGELKAMDTILDELAAKWKILNKDQQVALAQTVGGVRQYTQLIALMDQWDFMQENLQTVSGSSGALNEQQKTYSEGWRAAADRAKAALEGIYDTLIDDQKLKKLYGFAEIALNSINGIIKSLGGVRGILLQVASIILQIQAKNISGYLTNAIDSLKSAFGVGTTQMQQMLAQFQTIYTNQAKTRNIEAAPVETIESDIMQQQIALKTVLIEKDKILTNNQKEQANFVLAQIQGQGELLKLEAQRIEKNKANNRQYIEAAISQGKTKSNQLKETFDEGAARKQLEHYVEINQQLKDHEAMLETVTKQSEIWKKTDTSSIEEIKNALIQYLDIWGNTPGIDPKMSQDLKEIQTLLNDDTASAEQLKAAFDKAFQGDVMAVTKQSIEENKNDLASTEQLLDHTYHISGAVITDIREKTVGTQGALIRLNEQSKILGDNTKKYIKDLQTPQRDFIAGISSMASAVMMLQASINSIINVYDVWNDKNASTAEKIGALTTTGISGFSSLLRIIPIVKSAMASMGVAATTALGAIGIALLAISTIMSIVSKKREQANKEIEETTEKIKQQNAELNEHIDNIDKTSTALNDLKEAYAANHEDMKEWRADFESLIDQYDIQDGRLLLLQGKYDVLIEKIKTARTEELRRAASTGQDVIGEAEENLQKRLKQENVTPKYIEGTARIKGSEYQGQVEELIKSYGLGDLLDLRQFEDAGSQYAEIIASTDKITYEDIEKLQLFFEKLQQLETTEWDNHNIGINVNADHFLDSLQTVINSEEYKTLSPMWESQKAIELKATFSAASEEGTNKDPVDTLSEMYSLTKQLYGEGYKYNDILNEASNYLGDIANTYDTVRGAALQAGVPIQDMINAYEQLPENKKKLFPSIDFSKLDSINNLEKAIDDLQNQASKESIEIKLSLAKDDVDNFNKLKKDSTFEERQQWANSTNAINWGQDAEQQQQAKLSFLALSLEEQSEFVAAHMQNMQKEAIIGLNSLLDQGVESFDTYGKMSKAELEEIEDNFKYQIAYAKQTLDYFTKIGADEDKIAEWEFKLSQAKQDLQDFYAAKDNSNYAQEQYNATFERSNQLQLEYADSLSSIKEVEKAVADGVLTTAEAMNYAYSKFEKVMDPDIDTDNYEVLFDYLEKNAKDVEGLFKEGQSIIDHKALDAATKAILRYDSAVQKVSKDYDKWVKALDSGNLYEQALALEEIRNNYNDILDLPFNTLSDEFVNNRKNLELLKDVTDGVEGSYEELLKAAELDIVGHIALNDDDFQTTYDRVRDVIGKGLDNIEAEAYLNDAQAIAAMNELINSADLTYSQVMDLLGSMGVDAEVEQVNVPEQHEFVNAKPKITTETVKAPTLINGVLEDTDVKVPRIEYDWDTSEGKGSNTVTAWRIKSARKASGGTIKQNLAPSGGGGGGKSGGGGGGGSKKTGSAEHAKKASPQKSEDRYHVINNQIEDLAKQYDRLSEAEERAFGKTKLDLMEQQRKKLDEQYKAQRKLREEAEKYWKEDLNNLKNASIDSDGDGKPDTFGFERFNQDNWYANTHKDDQGNSLGPLDLLLDENGTILNYDQLTAAAYDFYNAKVAEYNQWLDDNYIGKEVDEAIEEEKKQREEGVKQEEGYLNNFLGLVKQYEDTQDKVQEEFNKEIEAYHAELDKMFENTEYAIQIKLDIDEDKLKILEFLMATLEDNAYRAGEAVANLQNQFAITGDKYENNKSAIEGLFDTHFAADHEFDNDNLDVDNNTFAAKMRGLGLNSGADIVASLMSGNTSLETILGSMGQEFSEQDIKAFREYTEAMMNDAESLLKIRQDMFKQLDDYISQTNDDLDRTRGKIENLSKITEHWKNLIDLVGRDTAGLDTQEMIDNEAESLKVLQAKVAADKDLMDEAEAVLSGLKAEEGKYEKGTNEWNEWKKRVEEAEDRFDEMTENFYSSWEEALQAVKEKFEKTMQWLGEDYSKALGGNAGSLEGLQNLMDQYEKTHSTYVPEFERVYQLNKLNAAAVKAIDETNNIKAKKQLQEYQQQILEAQESGREMSEYELQNLEKELALRQAALALEESRNVKSQVRMQRDNEGNYSYVYTADEDAVADAENNYRDKLYEMQKANYEYINELQNNIVSLEQDYQQAIANAAEIYGYGTEAYYDAVNKIDAYYDEALKAQWDELNLAMKNNQDLQEFDKNFHAQMTHDKSVSDEGYITSFDQTLYSQLTGYKTLEDATQAWSIASAEYISGATKAVTAYNSALEATCIYAGTTLKEQVAEPGGVYYQFGEKAKEAFAKAGKEAYGDGNLDDKNTLMGKVHLMAEQARKDLLGDGGENKGLIGTVGSFVEKTSEYINSLITDTTNLSTAIGNVIEQLSELGKAKIPEPKTPSGDNNSSSGEDNGSSSTNDSSSNGSSGNSGGDGNEAGPAGPTGPTERKQISKTPTGYKDAKDGSNHFTTYKITYDNGDVEISDPIKEPHTHGAAMSNDALWMCPLCYYTQLKATKEKTVFQEQESWRTEDDGRLKKNTQKRTVSGATGMYTGEWGSEGKLAILHEKELVLNKEDTANMLAAVGMIRQISDVIDLNAKSSGGAFSSLFAANVRTGAQELQQDVHITAEFPNATDHNEILEAFDNVINLASQYANRKVQPAYTSF